MFHMKSCDTAERPSRLNPAAIRALRTPSDGDGASGTAADAAGTATWTGAAVVGGVGRASAGAGPATCACPGPFPRLVRRLRPPHRHVSNHELHFKFLHKTLFFTVTNTACPGRLPKAWIAFFSKQAVMHTNASMLVKYLGNKLIHPHACTRAHTGKICFRPFSRHLHSFLIAHSTVCCCAKELQNKF